MDCPFCTLAPERIALADDQALVIRDAFPVSPWPGKFLAKIQVIRTLKKVARRTQ